MAYPTPAFETPQYSAETTLALDYLGAASPDGLPISPDDEFAVLEFADEITAIDEQLLVLDGLLKVAGDRTIVEQAIERREDEKFGRGLIEVVSTEEIPRAVSRTLKGKNPTVLVPASVWKGEEVNVGDELVDILSPLGDMKKVGEEQFPKSTMPAGSSGLHLDNFLWAPRGQRGFRYTFSSATLDSGKVLFLAGNASKRARQTGPKTEGGTHPYEDALLAMDKEPRVESLYRAARNGALKTPRFAFDTQDGTHMVGTLLSPGDTVIWPQGGPGSETAAWHAFRQVGDQPRTSTSSHFVKQ